MLMERMNLVGELELGAILIDTDTDTRIAKSNKGGWFIYTSLALPSKVNSS
jgi:hypothetical protein